jgi:hypothetical protein
MLKHYGDSDEQYIVGIYSVDLSQSTILESIKDLTGIHLYETSLTPFEEVGDFSSDVVIIKCHQFEEDFLDFPRRGISIYIVD